MATPTGLFIQPHLRDGVAVEMRPTSVKLVYRKQGCEIDFPAQGRAEAELLIELLRRGSGTDELAAAAPGFADQLDVLIHELDKLGLLDEGDVSIPTGAVSGRQFYRDLIRFGRRVERRVAQSELYMALESGAAGRNVLIGYAIEYYHLVRLSVGLIAPVVGHAASRRTNALLQEFMRSEMGHDRMLADALACVDIGIDVLDELQPLPSTFAVCATLGVLAAQDPLSFKSVVSIFEEARPRFNEAFARRCRELDMPTGFSEPILRHANINDEFDHGDITLDLLSEVEVIGAEEQVVAKKHYAVLIETLVKMEREILRQYDREPLALRRFG